MTIENEEEAKFSKVKIQRSLKKIAVEQQMTSRCGCKNVWGVKKNTAYVSGEGG